MLPSQKYDQEITPRFRKDVQFDCLFPINGLIGTHLKVQSILIERVSGKLASMHSDENTT